MKVVIVDDEAMVREWFASSIEKMAPDYQLAGTAHDGPSGLKLCRETKADIAVVDIKMPGMDGIELIGQLHKHCPRISTIVLSSYSDFDFARKAMKAGAADYLLKAEITHDTLREALEHIAPPLESREDAERTGFKNPESLANQLSRDALSSERVIAVVLLVQGNEEDKAVTDAFTRIGELLGCTGYCEYVRSEPDRDPTKSVYLGTLYLKKTLKRDSREIGPVFANRLIKQLHCSEREILVGIDGYTADISDLRIKMTSAVKAALCAQCHSEDMGIGQSEHDVPGMLYKRFERELEAGEKENAREIMEEILMNSRNNPASAISLFLDLVLEKSDRIEPAVLGKAIYDIARTIARGELTDSLAENLANRLSSRNRELIFSHPDTLSRTEPIARALDYMSRNYHKDLGLEEVGELVDLSPGYLSERFHKETGDYFQDHLAKLRLTKAAELLSRTQVPIRRIGELIGYPNPSYFGQVFKKQFGLSPGTYRKSNFQGKI